MKKLLIIDDEANFSNRYAESLRKLDLVNKIFEVNPMNIKDFENEMLELRRRQKIHKSIHQIL